MSVSAPTTERAGLRVRRHSMPGRSLRGLLPLAVLLAVWQFVGTDDALSFPRPSSWLSAISDMYEAGVLMPAIHTTLTTFAVSLVVSTVLGAAIGMLIGASRRVDRALTPIMDFFRTLPPPAIVPVAGLLLGATLQMSVTVVVIAIVWPIMLNTATAMRGVPQVRLEMSRTLGLSRVERLGKVVIPSLTPGIIVGVRISVSISLIVTLLVDILGSGDGLGRLIVERQQIFDAQAVWGLLLIIGLFGYVLNAAIAVGETRMLRNWSHAT